MLGNRQSVSVVRYQGRDLVLGVTANNISLLTESEISEEEEEASVPAAAFASFLKRGDDAD